MYTKGKGNPDKPTKTPSTTAPSKSTVKRLTELFQTDLKVDGKSSKESPEHSTGKSKPDAAAATTEKSGKFPSAKMKRRSFASQKPLARVSLIKSAMSFDSGNKSSSSDGSLESYSGEEAHIINRRAAFRKISNLTRGAIPDNKLVHRCSEDDPELPGNFSPRTSLKRQRSISAEGLADIRLSHSPKKESSTDSDNSSRTRAPPPSPGFEYCHDIALAEKNRGMFSGMGLLEETSCLSVSNPEMYKHLQRGSHKPGRHIGSVSSASGNDESVEGSENMVDVDITSRERGIKGTGSYGRSSLTIKSCQRQVAKEIEGKWLIINFFQKILINILNQTSICILMKNNYKIQV